MTAECCSCNILDKIDWGKNKGVKMKIVGLICLLIIFILMITIIICCTFTYYGGKCQLILDARSGEFPPLLAQNGQFKFPVSKNDKDQSLLSFVGGDILTLVCHGSSKGKSTTFIGLSHKRSVRLVCSEGDFLVEESNVKVDVLAASCNRRQEPVITRQQEECSPVGADGRTDDLEYLTRVVIGWDIEDNYVQQIVFCVDELLYATIWAQHTLHGANIAYRDTDPTRPVFRADTNKNHRFFPWTPKGDMDHYYSKRNQLEQVKKILKTDNKFGDKIIIDTSRSGTDYFSRGHLAPDAAFVYNVLQDATYYFFNVAPQFQSFNNGNWKALEFHIRALSIKLGHDLRVITGTHRILDYPNLIKILTPIFLFNSSYIPVPEYYWKVVEDPQTNRAVVFIGLNNPHVKRRPRKLCTSRCSDLPWVDWDIEDKSAGFMYCCEMQDARKALSQIPEVQADGGLLGVDMFL